MLPTGSFGKIVVFIFYCEGKSSSLDFIGCETSFDVFYYLNSAKILDFFIPKQDFAANLFSGHIGFSCQSVFFQKWSILSPSTSFSQKK
jgi:hypothetical protein